MVSERTGALASVFIGAANLIKLFFLLDFLDKILYCIKKEVFMTQNYINIGAGRERIMDLPNAMFVVHFSNTHSMLKEAHRLGIFLHKDDAHSMEYSLNVDFYSIRSHDGQPHVLLKVENGAVQLCRGVNLTRPKEYMAQVITFIVKKQFDIAHDMACTGIIRQDGQYYGVFDLPKGFVVRGDMDLSYAELEHLPNMDSVTIRGNYNVNGNPLKSLDGIPKEIYKNLYLQGGIGPDVVRTLPPYCRVHGKIFTGKKR